MSGKRALLTEEDQRIHDVLVGCGQKIALEEWGIGELTGPLDVIVAQFVMMKITHAFGREVYDAVRDTMMSWAVGEISDRVLGDITDPKKDSPN